MPFNPLSCIYGDYIIPQRYVLVLMICFGLVLAHCARICLYIAITEIAQYIPPTDEHSKVVSCPKFSEEEMIIQGGSYNWSQIEQSVILTSFFPGYFLSHLPGGIIADHYGGRHVFCLGVLLTGITSFLTPPVITYMNWKWLSVLRFVMGLSQGVLFPSSASLLSKWAPLRQRSLMVGIALAGVQLGSIFGYLISGFLIEEYGSWPIGFYFWGIFIFSWYLLSFFTFFSKPSSHPFITQQEKEMLLREIGETETFKIPWKRIMSDPAVLSLIALQYAHDWTIFTFIIDLPKYFKEVLKVNLKLNTIIISSSFAFTCVGSLISGYLSDYLIHHNLVVPIHIRKAYGFISSLGPSGAAIIAAHAGCNRYYVVSLLCLGMLLMGPWFTGPKVNTLDISLRFSGVLMSIINGIGATTGIVTPYVVAFVAPNGTQEQWQRIFWIAFLLSTAAAGIYTIWGSGERSQWDIETETS